MDATFAGLMYRCMNLIEHLTAIQTQGKLGGEQELCLDRISSMLGTYMQFRELFFRQSILELEIQNLMLEKKIAEKGEEFGIGIQDPPGPS